MLRLIYPTLKALIFIFSISGQFIFDGDDPNCLPDILLDEEEDFDPDYGKLMRDAKWISGDNESLLRVVQALIRYV